MRILRIYSLKNFSTDHIVHYLPPLCDLCFPPFVVQDGQLLSFSTHIPNTPSETMHGVGATIWEKSKNKTMAPAKRVICENKQCMAYLSGQ